MFFLPFIYFFLLTCYLWLRNRTFDISVYMSSLYTLTSFCAIVLVLGNLGEGGGILFDGWEMDLGLIPTVLYCVLLTITILPFSLIRTEKLTHISNNHPIIIFGFVLILLIQALINLYLVADSTMNILRGDLLELRNSHYEGDISPADLKAFSLPGPLVYFNYLNYSTILALPLFFYYTCVEKRSLWITWILLFISLSAPLKSLQVADRAEMILYGQMFLFCLIFFRKKLTAPIKKFFYLFSIPAVGLFALYLTAVSTARFEDRDEGTAGSILQYVGQPYLNFCYFYENANPNLIYPQREFPILSHVVFKKDYTNTKDERSAKEGFFIGVFATHVGAWLLDVGLSGCIIYASMFALICILLIKFFNRQEYEITEVLLIFILATTPIFGIFYPRFYSLPIALQYLIASILYLLSRYHFVWGETGQPDSSITNETQQPLPQSSQTTPCIAAGQTSNQTDKQE